MKKNILSKLMFFVFCAMAGSLTGYGIVGLANADSGKENNSTKDNTLVREMDDSVFFDGNQNVTVKPLEAIGDEKIVGQAVVTLPPEPSNMPETIPVPEVTIAQKMTPVPEMAITQKVTPVPEVTRIVPHATATPMPTSTPMPTPTTTPIITEYETVQTITYPAKIFGQTPVVNRSDAYVTYFEFCLDLIEAVEPEVKRRGLSETSLIAKFVFKALLCGVDVQKVEINAPIPREMAALALWLAAQVMDEEGTDTSSKQVTKYVTDIGKCSGSEKKAVAYLYEQGIIPGYQVSGQTFCPNQNLETEDGNAWLEGVKQCWK